MENVEKASPANQRWKSTIGWRIRYILVKLAEKDSVLSARWRNTNERCILTCSELSVSKLAGLIEEKQGDLSES